jgi:phage-related tail fiber protein
MNSVIKVRRSYTPGAVPTTAVLEAGQFAINTADQLLYIADGSGNIINLGGAGAVVDYTGDVTGSGSVVTGVALTIAPNGVTAGTYDSVTVDATGRVTAGTNEVYVVVLTTTAANQVVDTFDTTLVRSATYEMQMETESGFFTQVSEVKVVHNGTTPQFVEYAVLYSDSQLGTFSVTISGTTLSLELSPVNTNTTLTFKRSTLAINQS